MQPTAKVTWPDQGVHFLSEGSPLIEGLEFMDCRDQYPHQLENPQQAQHPQHAQIQRHQHRQVKRQDGQQIHDGERAADIRQTRVLSTCELLVLWRHIQPQQILHGEDGDRPHIKPVKPAFPGLIHRRYMLKQQHKQVADDQQGNQPIDRPVVIAFNVLIEQPGMHPAPQRKTCRNHRGRIVKTAVCTAHSLPSPTRTPYPDGSHTITRSKSPLTMGSASSIGA